MAKPRFFATCQKKSFNFWKGKTELWDEKRQCEPACLGHMMKHLAVINPQLQGQDRVITDTFDAVLSF